jgi:ankyrin repeat protein
LADIETNIVTDSPKPTLRSLGIRIGRPNAEGLQRALDAGVDLHALSENDYSLLHCAAENGAMENVVFLLDIGVDPTTESLGKTAADLARAQNQNEIADLIDARINDAS